MNRILEEQRAARDYIVAHPGEDHSRGAAMGLADWVMEEVLMQAVQDADLRAPFPWFGGKSRVAPIVWERFGDVPNYVEPFFGSGAVLLGRPHAPRTETVNDKDCLLANFWRALQHDPDGVAEHADWPVNEADLSARHLWLVDNVEFQERMKTDPDHYDVKIAGWWAWGLCQWIGSGWCSGKLTRQLPHLGDAGKGVHRQLPHLAGDGMGVHRKRPHLAGDGKGVHRKRPMLGGHSGGVGVHRPEQPIYRYMRGLAERLRRVRVCCGDWERICGPSPTFKHGLTGVLLDPPYADTAGRDPTLYASDSLTVAHDVRRWAIANGDNPLMRIALCGYDGEHEMPETWECCAWKAHGGYSGQATGKVNENRHKERIWFSPHCLRGQQGMLF